MESIVMTTPFTQNLIALIKSIPKGCVCTYGTLSKAAGNPKGARQVARVLHTFSEKENLPWHRVVNREGKISLKPHEGYEIQQQLLETEGIIFDENNTIDLKRFLWTPTLLL